MIKNWKRYFYDLVLERGQYYYLQNKVKGLSYNNDIYSARVMGQSAYNVEIKWRNDRLVFMKCSCPHALKGNYCKHMAAVLYAIEDVGDALLKEQDVSKQVNPFRIATEEYQYFDMGRITKDMSFSERIYAEAKTLVENGKVVLERINVGYNYVWRKDELCAVIYGSVQNSKFPTQISMIVKRNGILQARCGVSRCYGYYEFGSYYSSNVICEHLLALMILADENFRRYKLGDLTDAAGQNLVSGFRNLHFKDVLDKNVEEVADFHMEPVLECVGSQLNLGFRAGTDKMYVVKNLTDLMERYNIKDTIQFGTKTEVDFAKHRIDESSKPVFEYIKKIVEQEQARSEHARQGMSNYYESEQIRNQIGLFGEWLDQFFEIFEGQKVACNDKTGVKTVKTEFYLGTGKPKISLQIKPNLDEEEVFHGLQVEGNVPDFLKGNQFYYFIEKDKLCRIDDKVLKEIQPILDLSNYGEISFQVGRKKLSEFYYQILPMLKKNANVNEIDVEIIEKNLPPEPSFAFYLDSEKGSVRCKSVVRYGEQEVSLLDNYRTAYILEGFRNTNLEEEILYHLHEYFKDCDINKDELISQSEDDILRLLDGGIERLMGYGEVHTTERFRNMNIRKKPKLQIGVSLKSDVMNLSISSEDVSQEELLELLKSYQRKKKYYRLKNGDFIAVNETDMEMLSEMMENLKLSPKEFLKGDMKVPVYRALYLNKMLEKGENIYLDRDKHFKNIIKEFKTVEDSDFEIPSSLKSIMRNYQIHGFKWLKTLEHYRFGGILADDMGLGKTLQMISVLLSAKESGKLGTAIIISPASLVYNWKEEFSKFAPELKVITVAGTQRERAEIIQQCEEYDVLITSYDLLKRDVAEYEDVKFTYQILDEAQYIKNHSTAAAKSVKVLQSKYRYALTGTPIENRLSELWSIFDYLMPGFLYGYDTFRKQFETPIVKYKEENVSEQLKKMVAPFILRRLKGDVLKDLPDKIEEVRYAKLEDKQQTLYDAQVVHMREVLEKQKEDSVYKLIAKGTIEEKIVQMQESKRDLADSILSGDMGSITQMSKQELMELLIQ